MHSTLKLSLVELPWEYLSFYFSFLFHEGTFSILLTPTGHAAFLCQWGDFSTKPSECLGIVLP